MCTGTESVDVGMKKMSNKMRVTYTSFSVQLGINMHGNVNTYSAFLKYFKIISFTSSPQL